MAAGPRWLHALRRLQAFGLAVAHPCACAAVPHRVLRRSCALHMRSVARLYLTLQGCVAQLGTADDVRSKGCAQGRLFCVRQAPLSLCSRLPPSLPPSAGSVDRSQSFNCRNCG
jgi:hypothetical protein